ncbi:hypothetical protein NNC19_22390 [Clostridium sp. SHJSY1]|uniref:hypothetical protein n=1 Tax=Clostridium sp. SHJSY1 TaxID=2942483 RepID=UPI00287410CB|nr:hypothetical protein [Clostridium sp. SHJSY1]MDS0528442.1 hypothetical protein [Clostridium sp. SHJSY1]
MSTLLNTLLFLYIISIIVYSLFIKLGFFITKSYIDIKAVLITVVIISIVSLITSKLGFAGSIINTALQYYLLYKIGGTDPWPETALALAVGKGLYLLTGLLLSVNTLHF